MKTWRIKSFGFRDLNEEFAECINNSSNGVSAVGPSVFAAGLEFTNSTNDFTTAGPLVSVAELNFTNSTNDFSVAGPSNAAILNLEDFSHNADNVGAEADTNNMESIISVSPIPTTRIHKDHPTSQIIDTSQLPDDPNMPELEDITYSDDENDVGAEADFNNLETSITVSTIPTTRVHKDHHIKVDFLRKIMMTSIHVYLPDIFHKKNPRWNKKDERGIVVRNKARLVAQGHTQEKGIDYEEVFALVARIEAIRLFLAYASFIGFMVYQIAVKSAFRQDKYVAEILKKFGLTDGKSASTPIDIEKPLLKDPNGEDVDVHTYRSMIGSLMYLTSSRLDIMFAVCACAHFQVIPKASHLHAVKRIFRYLKGKPHLGLWYPKDSPFDLVAYSDSDYAGTSLDKKFTTAGCQFLRCRVIS
nr:hypothetical protein [Tanacetum cinerariifolium]